MCDYIVQNNIKIKDNKDIANVFNDFYINVGPKLAGAIDDSNIDIKYNDYVKNIENKNTMFVRPTTETEILNVVYKFNSKNSEDISGLRMTTLKCIIGSILKPLSYISNLSLSSGVFPDDLKIAKVLPLFKSGEVNEVNNYRPVSVLPQMSKILEKLFELRLRKYINKCDFLFKGQYGFRTNHSTNLALNEMVNMIVNAIDNKMFSIGVFIDLKKLLIR